MKVDVKEAQHISNGWLYGSHETACSLKHDEWQTKTNKVWSDQHQVQILPRNYHPRYTEVGDVLNSTQNGGLDLEQEMEVDGPV